jgi:hypothetical protein
MSTVDRTPTTGETGAPIPEPNIETNVEVPVVHPARAYVGKRLTNRVAYARLRAELATARPEFELVVERSGSGDDSWAVHGRSLLDAAKAKLRMGAIGEAWRHLHTARRLELYGLEKLDDAHGANGDERHRSELDLRAAVVREEALDALGGWRRRAVVNLLCDGEERLKPDLGAAEIEAAMAILHEQYETVHMARTERQHQFNQLVLMGAFSGLVLLVLTFLDWWWDPVPTTRLVGRVAAFLVTPFGSGDVDTTAPGLAVYMTIAGVMGASLFGIRSLRNRSLSTKIPQQVNLITVTSARGVIGAVSALLFYFVLQTSLLDGGVILADDAITAPMMVVVGFAAGYTERLAPSVVARISSITETGGAADSDGRSNEKRGV